LLATREGGALPGKSSAEALATVWGKARLWWPIERVPVFLEIVHPRALNALEWVLLRVVDEFGEDLPTLNEVAAELGVDDPVFLRETLGEVVRRCALAPRDGSQPWSDLPDLRFTPDGHRLFRLGKIEGDPAQQGAVFVFDGLTGEARTEPAGVDTAPKTRFPASAPPPEPRGGIGLDLARELVSRFHSDLLKGGGEVRAVQLRTDVVTKPVWAPVDVELILQQDGRLVPRCPQLSAAGAAVLQACRPVEDGVLPEDAAVGVESEEARAAVIGWDAWKGRAARTLPHAEITKRVLQLLMKPPRDLWLHSAWLQLPGMQKRVENAARAGARVVVVSSPTTEVTLHLDAGPRVGVVAYLASTHALPGALMIDSQLAVVRGEVAVTYGERAVPVSLTGELGDPQREQARDMFAQAIRRGLATLSAVDDSHVGTEALLRDNRQPAASAFDDTGVKVAVARLLLLGERDDLDVAVRSLVAVVHGPDLVEVLSRLGTIAQAAVAGLSAELAHAAARAAWRDQLQDPGAGSDVHARLQALARVAPLGASPVDFVQLALVSSPAVDQDPTAALGFITSLREAVDARWSKGAAAAVPAFVSYRTGVLGPTSRPDWPLRSRVRAARQLLNEEQLSDWALVELRRLPRPGGPSAFEELLATAEAVREVAPRQVAVVVGERLRELVLAGVPDQSTLVRIAARVVPTELLLGALLTNEHDVRDVVAAYQELVAAGLGETHVAMHSRLKACLPRPKAPFASSDVAVAAKSLAAVVNDDPAIQSLVRGWARDLVSVQAPPQTPGELGEWLSALQVLAPVLHDISAIAWPHVVRLRGPLSTARGAREPAWDDVRRHWRDLGLAEARLLDFTAPSSNPNEPPALPGEKQTRRKRR
jgi:hypothetical protein